VQQRLTHGLPERLRVLGSRCCTSDARPGRSGTAFSGNARAATQPLVGYRTCVGSGAAVELSAMWTGGAARRRSSEGGVPLLWMGASRGPLAPLVGGAPIGSVDQTVRGYTRTPVRCSATLPLLLPCYRSRPYLARSKFP
jgi:hypothetical protein